MGDTSETNTKVLSRELFLDVVALKRLYRKIIFCATRTLFSGTVTYGICACVLDTCCHATLCGISANSSSIIHTYDTCTCVLDTCCYATMCGRSANSSSTIHTYDTCTCVLDTCCYATMCGISANSGSTTHTYDTCTCVLDTCCYATMCGRSANSGSTIQHIWHMYLCTRHMQQCAE